MARQLRVMFWRCSRCGQTNRLQTVATEYEPATYVCEHCGEDTVVQLQDLTESATKINLRRFHKHPNESDADGG